MDWNALVLLAWALAALIVVPGAILLRALGAPPLAALSAGPAITLMIVAIAGIGLEAVGIGWGTGSQSALGAAVLVSPVVSWLARRWLAARCQAATPPDEASAELAVESSSGSAPVAAGWLIRALRGLRALRASRLFHSVSAPRTLLTAVAAILAALPAGLIHALALTRQMGEPDTVHQNMDSVLHMNLIEEIYRTGNSSILTAARSINGAIYPDGFHSIAVVLRPWANSSQILNASLIAVGAILLPLTVVLLARAVGLRWWAASLAALLGTATMWVPAYMVFFNALMAAALAMVALLGVVAALLALPGHGRRHLAALAALALAGLGGVGAAHPGGAQALLVILCVLGAVRLSRAAARQARAGKRRNALLRLLGAVGCLLPVGIMPLVPALRTMSGFPGDGRTIGDTASMSFLLTPLEGQAPSGWLEALGALAVAGAVLLALRGRWAPVTVWGTLVALALTTASADPGLGALTGAWWRDLLRVLALLVLVDGVLAAGCVQELGALGARAWPARIGPSLSWRGRVARAPHVAGALAVCAALGMSIPACRVGAEASEYWSYYAYQWFTHYKWLDADEAEELQGENRDAFAGAMVYGSPETGATYVAVLTDGTSFYRHYGAPINWKQQYLAQNFSKIRTDPRVCAIIRAQGGVPMYYEQPDLPPEAFDRYPGFWDVDTSKGFVRVADVGGATLWRITACEEKGRTP